MLPVVVPEVGLPDASKITAEKNVRKTPVTISPEQVFQDHVQWLRGLLTRRLRVQPTEADDLVQETYLRLACTAEPISHPRALLSRIALNLFRDSKRREAVRTQHRNVVQLASVRDRQVTDMSEQEASFLLRQIILDMPELYRDVFALSRFRHMTNRDIADHLGISVKTVEWRIGKALEYCVSRLRD
ncbi:RNA polymerase sigma factor [Sphingomonas nostoxanthinifaciens]|uniref:RNA polymerase sigma factor n=1 Tax=Sphingomonas nostoxanthinifaciens TaxID=2872652 RepID=UPI001CC210F3|nr:RNA polymerase sigma factor [Sphingomonas nostoxanthinifaciens]UAK26507.1 RNA polymerase sigma factor [Sphingomonas nostoxanthinifaciens]